MKVLFSPQKKGTPPFPCQCRPSRLEANRSVDTIQVEVGFPRQIEAKFMDCGANGNYGAYLSRRRAAFKRPITSTEYVWKLVVLFRRLDPPLYSTQ
ncbi:hypothetical protein CEXT_211381 [Caerostris extrusa]|uniref:Uncharacterized protein n=1 Tax=Caerostris extrusa TaxID=172846 RepID=A0AAV4QFZ2_CAEEX|nr:hypothetical protein CEXT_211381 [Caerostris extrusa]